MNIQHVNGKKDKGKVFLFALSTCVWCRKTKRLLNALGIAYDYLDVDLLPDNEVEEVKEQVKKWNPRGSYPTIVLNDSRCIIGFNEKEIKEVLGNGA
jgi:glutaredoxin